jgi:hypothetical protein
VRNVWKSRLSPAFLIVFTILSSCSMSHAAQITTKQGDVLVGDLAFSEIKFRIGDQNQTLPTSDLLEWRLDRLLKVDGTVNEDAKLTESSIPINTRMGSTSVPSKNIASISFAPSAVSKSLVATSISDSNKESIKTVSTLTLQFILIAVGLFSLAGTLLAYSPGQVVRPFDVGLSLFSFILLGASVFMGYLVHSSIISQLEFGQFSAYRPQTLWTGLLQVCFFVFGGGLFGWVTLRAFWSRGVAFRFNCRCAKEVTLVGSFNNWGELATKSRYRMWRLLPFGKKWRLTIKLPSGTHEYLFLVKIRARGDIEAKQEYIQDPQCDRRVPNVYGGENNYIQVP